MLRKLFRFAVALAVIAALAVGFFVWVQPADELETPVINRGLTCEKVVALTFDDGPHPITTPLLLDTLKTHKVRATFFAVGEKAEEYPELLRRIAKAGHQVACHTYSHDNMTYLTRREAENELTYWERDVDKIIGRGPRYLRPPGGDFNRNTISLARERGYVLSLWSVNPGDWNSPPPPRIVKYVLTRVHPGAVIIMHDDGMNTIRALPLVIKGLRKQGYRFVTLDEMRRLGFTSRQTVDRSSTPSHPAGQPSRASSAG